jgi:lipoprotein NlpI
LAEGDYAGALKDYDAAIALGGTPGAYQGRGVVRLAMAQYQGAADDFQKVIDLGKANVWGILRLHIARSRIGAADFGALAAAGAKLDPAEWPSPLFDMFLGRTLREQVEAAAGGGDPRTRNVRECDVGFYGGEYAAIEGDMAAARTLFERAAADDCGVFSAAREGAVAELARLKE